MTATESIASAVSAEFSAPLPEIDRALIDELWRACSAASWGLHQEEFAPILLDGGAAQNFGLPDGTAASPSQQAAFFRALCLDDLVLARACALGNERAWEHFLAVYRQPLIRAAVAITGSETLGRDLADQLYGELYGLTERDGPPLPAALVSGTRIADGLAAYHPGPAPRRSPSPQLAPDADGGVDRRKRRAGE